MATTTSGSKPKAKRTGSSASKGSSAKKASGTSRSKRSSSTSIQPSPSPAKAATVRRKVDDPKTGVTVSKRAPKTLVPTAPAPVGIEFHLGLKEGKAGKSWCAKHVTHCRLTERHFTWSFTPRTDGVTLVSVACACGRSEHLVSDPGAKKSAKAPKEPAQLLQAHDPFAAFSARALAKKSGATRERDGKGQTDKGGTSKSSSRVAG